MCGTVFFLLLVAAVVYYAAKRGSKQPPAAACYMFFVAGFVAGVAAMVVVATMVINSPAKAQQNCPGGVCPVPSYVNFGQPFLQVAPTAIGQPQYQWKKHETAADNWVLWLGSQHVGTYRSDQGLFYPWHGTKFGPAQKSPPTAPPTEAGEPLQDFGMGWRPNGQDKWTAAGGKEITGTAAARDLIDDSGRGFVVGVFADKATGESMKKDWQNAGEFRDKYHLQVYDAGTKLADAAKDRGYTDGVYVIGADGKELARAQSYSGLDGLLDTLKRLKDGGGGPLIAPQVNVPTWVWVAGLVLVGYLFGKRSN